MNPFVAGEAASSTIKNKDGRNAWMVVSAGPMDGRGVAYSHLLHSAARHLHGVHRERPSHHVSWSGLVAGAAECGGGTRSGAHDRGRLSRITTEKYSAASDRRPGGLRQCRKRRERGRPQSAVAHGSDRTFGQP